jgi:hypothetical protein
MVGVVGSGAVSHPSEAGCHDQIGTILPRFSPSGKSIQTRGRRKGVHGELLYMRGSGCNGSLKMISDVIPTNKSHSTSNP